MNNSIPERFIFQCALFKNLEREVFMTHGYVDSHIIDQALRLRLKDETSVILSDLYLQILQYIEMHPASYRVVRTKSYLFNKAISICKYCSTLKCIRLH